MGTNLPQHFLRTPEQQARADSAASRPDWGYVKVTVYPGGHERAPVASRTVDDWRVPGQAAAALREIADELDAKETRGRRENTADAATIARSAIVAADITARNERYSREAKFCPACGSGWLGGVPGDLSLLGCCDCGQRVPKYLYGREAIGA